MFRKIIKIDENKCDGCGLCIPECHEGALQIIDGKARLISDLFCDGLGACIGFCPTGALTIEERVAEPYDEKKVMDYIIKGGGNVIKAHLEHLRDHEEFEYLTQALEYLRDIGIENPLNEKVLPKKSFNGCPGSKEVSITHNVVEQNEIGSRTSHLKQWPIQLHLVSPHAAYYKNSDLLLAADCCGFAYAELHKDFIQGKSIAIACPKLDTNKQVYLEKLISMINDAEIKSITVLVMEVPCCNGLTQLALQATEFSERNISVNTIVVGINGEILKNVKII